MPRRRSPETQRTLWREDFTRIEYEAYDVHSVVIEALAKELDKFRRAHIEPVPPYIEVTPETPAQAAERGFEVGFVMAATTFWEDIARGRERRRTAQRGADSSASKRKNDPAFGAKVREAADAYRAAHPYSPRGHSTRAMALHIGKKLDKPQGTVLKELRRQGKQ